DVSRGLFRVFRGVNGQMGGVLPNPGRINGSGRFSVCDSAPRAGDWLLLPHGLLEIVQRLLELGFNPFRQLLLVCQLLAEAGGALVNVGEELALELLDSVERDVIE